MKKMRKVSSLLFALVLGFQLMAQDDDEGRNYGATPEDSIVCVQSLSLYSEFYKQDNYKDALQGWRKALEVCPGSSKNLYIRGVKMLEFFIDEAEKQGNDERKNRLVDSLLALYDLRIENFGEEGKVLASKGVDMMKYRKDDPAAAFAVLNKSLELEGNDYSPAAVVYVFLAKYYMYAKKLATKEELLELYPKLAEVVDYNVNNNEKYSSIYEKAGENLEKYFAKVADCPDLVELFTPKLDAMKSDAKALKNLMKILDKRGCSGEDLYLNAAIALNEIEPNADAAYGIAIGMLKREKYSEAIKFFQKSIDLNSDDNNKNFDAYLNKAKAHLISKEFQSCKISASKALEIKPNSGEAILLIGDAYGYGGKECGKNECDAKANWWLAYDYYSKAKNADSSVAEKADKKMAQAREQFPTKENCFFYTMSEGDSYTFEGCWISGTTTVRTK